MGLFRTTGFKTQPVKAVIKSIGTNKIHRRSNMEPVCPGRDYYHHSMHFIFHLYIYVYSQYIYNCFNEESKTRKHFYTSKHIQIFISFKKETIETDQFKIITGDITPSEIKLMCYCLLLRNQMPANPFSFMDQPNRSYYDCVSNHCNNM